MWKWLAALLFLLLFAAALWAKSVSWRTDHFQLSEPMVSPSGLYYAQVFKVPDGLPKAYGDGVYIGYRFVPPWLNSTLVFSAYCRDTSLNWSDSQELEVSCRTSDEPLHSPAPAGITVKFSRRS